MPGDCPDASHVKAKKVPTRKNGKRLYLHGNIIFSHGKNLRDHKNYWLYRYMKNTIQKANRQLINWGNIFIKKITMERTNFLNLQGMPTYQKDDIQ